MYDWSKLKNFRLAKGSHDDPTGGAVCLVEAALLHGGFRYKAIKTAYDAPTCFSWIITHYAISLNDQMPDDLRHELLLPFVGRLAWTHRDSGTEQRRLKYIAQKIDITGWKANSALLAWRSYAATRLLWRCCGCSRQGDFVRDAEHRGHS